MQPNLKRKYRFLKEIKTELLTKSLKSKNLYYLVKTVLRNFTNKLKGFVSTSQPSNLR